MFEGCFVGYFVGDAYGLTVDSIVVGDCDGVFELLLIFGCAALIT